MVPAIYVQPIYPASGSYDVYIDMLSILPFSAIPGERGGGAGQDKDDFSSPGGKYLGMIQALDERAMTGDGAHWTPATKQSDRATVAEKEYSRGMETKPVKDPS